MAKDAPDGVLMITTTVIVDLEPIIPLESNEYIIDTYGSYSGSSSDAQDLFNREVPESRKGILQEIELACDNYDVSSWYIEVKGVAVIDWETLPESLSKLFPMVEVAAGQSVIVQVKSDGSTTINAYCDVSYKEVG